MCVFAWAQAFSHINKWEPCDRQMKVQSKWAICLVFHAGQAGGGPLTAAQSDRLVWVMLPSGSELLSSFAVKDGWSSARRLSRCVRAGSAANSSLRMRERNWQENFNMAVISLAAWRPYPGCSVPRHWSKILKSLVSALGTKYLSAPLLRRGNQGESWEGRTSWACVRENIVECSGMGAGPPCADIEMTSEEPAALKMLLL